MTPPGPALALPAGCREAILLRREKRFLVEIELPGSGSLWIHTNNSGSMLGLIRPGARCVVSPGLNPKRKLPYTLELVENRGVWLCVNTQAPNRLLAHGHVHGLIPELAGCTGFRAEARTGMSRLDARLVDPEGRPLWVECKNVTLCEEEVGYFPDAVSARGTKHLRELVDLVVRGERAAMFYLVREDARCFAPADFIDPAYVAAFAEAVSAGVEIWAHACHADPQGLRLGRRLPVVDGAT
jgi:sugar fermentation stimulation protein A